jgi:hypothetical protein
MADLTITAANVVAGEDVSIEAGIAGATITAGQVVYRDTADSKYKLADADGAAALRSPRGIALNGASNGQPLSILRNGDITIGATMTAGLDYYLSDDPGGICPKADLATGDYIVLVGMAESTSVLNVEFVETGVVT